MDRRRFIAATLGLLAVPLAAEAQPAGKIPRIGFLSLRAGPTAREEEFRGALHELGYAEEKNIAIDYRWAGGRVDSLPRLAAELIALHVDLIVAVPNPAILVAKDATRTTPIVMVAGTDPVETGVITSLARPGGNITGLAVISHELVGKRLQLLKEVVPGVSRVAVLAQQGFPGTALLVREVQTAGRQLEIGPQIVEVRVPSELNSAFAAMKHAHADAVLILGGIGFFDQRRQIAELAARHRLPVMYPESGFMDAGGLMSYGQSYPEMYRRAATYVDKILKGAKPADLPVEQPTKFELVINLKTAKALGLTIPQSVLARADEVIE